VGGDVQVSDDLTPQQADEARTLLDSVPAVHWAFAVDYPRGSGTWSGESSMDQIRAAESLLTGLIGGFPVRLLDGIETELRKSLDQVAAARRGDIPPPTFFLEVESE
jgi:hypothetical protein